MILLKYILSLWALVLVPVYWQSYGPENFLWFSDIGLFGTIAALWFESHLLMSMIILVALIAEIVWNIDFFMQLLFSQSLGLADYMFEPKYTLFLRSLSLFHVILPFLWISYLFTKGYDVRALPYAIILSWVVLVGTYMFTNPATNINWVFSPYIHHWTWISPLGWLLVMMLLFAGFIWIQHRLFLLLFAA